MSEDERLDDRLLGVYRRHPEYELEAYRFIQRAVSYTIGKLTMDGRLKGRHVSGQQLLEGVRDLALEEFGPFAAMVFRHWSVAATDDIGAIVFLLVESDLLAASDEDTLLDFRDGFDFETVFEDSYRPEGYAVASPVIDG